jgi:hypothetical protein
MFRVSAKYQYLTCDEACCFQAAQKRDVIFSWRRRYFAAAKPIAPAAALSNNPADAQTSVGPSKVKPAAARKSGAPRSMAMTQQLSSRMLAKLGAGLHLATGT